MSIFDLLLILLVLATAVGIVIAVASLFLRRRAVAGRFLAGVVMAWTVYLGVGAVVALSAPQHIMALGEDRCFDECVSRLRGGIGCHHPWRQGGRQVRVGPFMLLPSALRTGRAAGRSGSLAGRECSSTGPAESMRYPEKACMSFRQWVVPHFPAWMRKLDRAKSWKQSLFLNCPRMLRILVSRWLATWRLIRHTS